MTARSRLLNGLIIGLAYCHVLTGCEGDDGIQGPTGSVGPVGTLTKSNIDWRRATHDA